MSDQLKKVKDLFISEWGALGTSWGTNKTIAQIHATLLAEPEPINTDELMEKLKISRGNAHSGLKELVSWGIVKKIVIKGERKEFFSAEKDPWKILCLISKERRKKEIEPALQVLEECLLELKTNKSAEAVEFSKLIGEMHEFIKICDRLMEKLGNSEKSLVAKTILKMLS